ncbi:hypothetical protein [Acidiphilium sp. PM]|nr:hypothetical protein [Acidiphilium sp. PM]
MSDAALSVVLVLFSVAILIIAARAGLPDPAEAKASIATLQVQIPAATKI